MLTKWMDVKCEYRDPLFQRAVKMCVLHIGWPLTLFVFRTSLLFPPSPFLSQITLFACPLFPSSLYTESLENRVALKLSRELIFENRRYEFFVFLRELIFAVVKDLFFLLGINFCDFREVKFNWNKNIFAFSNLSACNWQEKQHVEMSNTVIE